MCHFVTVYEYHISSILGFILLLALFAVAGPVVAAAAISRIRATGWRVQVAAMLLWGTGGALAGVVGLAIVLWRHAEVARWYETGDFEVIEGPVRVLRIQPASGHAPGDLIDIAGRTIEINFFAEIGPGYRQTIARGGVLQDGRRVRLFVHEGKVLRVDIDR
jgi:hypothetical protein